MAPELRRSLAQRMDVLQRMAAPHAAAAANLDL
jgi:hypothetical protein